MGYTHYWYRKLEIKHDKMRAIFDDFTKVLPEFQHFLANWNGKEGTAPEISTIGFSFNGIGEESHESFVFNYP